MAAPDHPVLTPRGWLEAGKLTTSDAVGWVTPQEDFGNDAVLAEEARLLGYLVGDGSCQGSPNITVADDPEADDIIACIASCGFEHSIQSYHMAKTGYLLRRVAIRAAGKRGRMMRGGAGVVRLWLEKHGLAGKTSYTKRVPRAVMSGSKRVAAEFLAAYWACDGYLSHRGVRRDGTMRPDIIIGCDSVNRDLLEDVRLLLQSIGVATSFRKKVSKIKTAKQGDTYTSWALQIATRDDCARFFEHVNIRHSKMARFHESNNRRLEFDAVLRGDAVASNEDGGMADCRCLTVEEDESFVANGIAVHNSSITSVAWPTWHWGKHPETRFGFASHDEKLAERDAVKARALIESRWYQNRFGDKFKINPKIDRQDKYANDKWGERIALGTGSKLTGEGADIWVVDDANDAQDAMSEAKLEATRDWLDTVLSTRFNDPKSARFVSIQQRIHEKDATGHLQEKFGKDMVNLVLPMEFEEERRCVTVKLPSTGDKPWSDPRTYEGEPLCEARWGEEEINTLKRSLRSQYAIAGQLQQRPAPAEGGMIKRAWFKLWQHSETPRFECVLQSWDTATSEKEDAAYSACTTWGVFRDQKNQPAALLLSMWRDRLEYPELREMVKRLAYDYLDDETHEPLERPNPNNAPDIVLIESKSSGLTLIPDLMRAGIRGVMPFDPTRFGDKIGRVRGVTHLIQNGRVYLPCSSPGYQYPKPWAMEFVNQCVGANTLLYTETGLKKIADIHPGEMVMTHRGRFRRVLGKSERLASSAYRLKAKTLDPLIVTGEHPVMSVMAKVSGSRHVAAAVGWKPVAALHPRSVRAITRGGITKLEKHYGSHDRLTLPAGHFGTMLDFLDLKDFVRPAGKFGVCVDKDWIRTKSGRQNRVLRNLGLTKTDGFLVGLYLAEGCVGNGGSVRISLNARTEAWLAKQVLDFAQRAFGVTGNTSRQGSCLIVSFGMAVISPFWEQFGRSSDQKLLPPWVFAAPLCFKMGVLEGWVAGDGHVRASGETYGSTVSPSLAWGMRLLANQLGIAATTRRVSAKPTAVIRGRRVTQRDAYRVEWRAEPKRGGVTMWAGDYASYSLDDMEEITSPTMVYNIQVEEDETYLTTSGVVHNCMLFPKAESRDLVDTMTQALLRLSASGWVVHTEDPRPPDEDYRRMVRESERYDYASPY